MDIHAASLNDGVHACRKLDFNIEINTEDHEKPMDDDCILISSSVNSEKATNEVDAVHSKIRKEMIPIIGMEFETENEAYIFYINYARCMGFSVRRSKFHNFKDGKLRDRTFVCSAEGKRGPDKRDVDYKHHRAETRCGCFAKMKINCKLIREGEYSKYQIVDFVPEHKHVTTPCKNILKRCSKKIKARPSLGELSNPKERIVWRYKELCRLYAQLATKAAESENLYNIAIMHHNKASEEVDVCMKEKPIGHSFELNEQPFDINKEHVEIADKQNEIKEQPTETIKHPNRVDERHQMAKGIKTKSKKASYNTSKRRKNALEVAVEKRKHRADKVPSSNVDVKGVLFQENISSLSPQQYERQYYAGNITAQVSQLPMYIPFDQSFKMTQSLQVSNDIRMNLHPRPLPFSSSEQFDQQHQQDQYLNNYQVVPSSTGMLHLLQEQHGKLQRNDE